MPRVENQADDLQSDQIDTGAGKPESGSPPASPGASINRLFEQMFTQPVDCDQIQTPDAEAPVASIAEDGGLRLFLSPRDIAALSSKFDSTYQRFTSAKSMLEKKVQERTEDLVNVQRRLELIIDSISEAVITFDESGSIESFSRSAEAIFGYTESSVVNLSVATMIPCLANKCDDYDIAEGSLGLKSDGTPIKIEGRVRSLTFNQERLFVATVRDVTEQQYTRKLLEEQAFLIEKSKSFVLVTNSAHQIEWCNPCFETMTGYTKSQLIGKRVVDLLLDDSTDVAAIEMVGSACRNRESYSVEVILVHSTGRPFWIQMESHPMFTEDGQLDKYVALGVDITEQKQREAQQADFVSMVSHELRTPLTVVSGALDALEMSVADLPSGMERSLVEMGQRNCDQLSTLIEDLLDINKLEAGVVRFQSQEIDVADPVRDGIRTVASLADESGIELLASYCDERIPVFVDPQRLLQVVINLLSNAVKFSRPGGKIQVRLSSDGRIAKIEVADEGIGIPLGFREKVFERFARDAQVQAMGKEGFGLGLSICKGLVELMEGRIYFESTEGQGSTFTVEIPVSANARAEGSPAEPQPVQYEYQDDTCHTDARGDDA